MSRRKLWTRRVLLVGLLCLGLEQAWRHGHDYIFADRFATVVPGKLYRGAWQQTWPMRRLLREHHIKTVVALAHPDDHPLAVREKALTKELGVKWLHIPIVDDRNGLSHRTLAKSLDDAAAELARPENQPVYFHCHHGINRASMVQMAYRMRYCGWTLEQATDEISRHFGLVAVNHGPDYRHMTDYYKNYVLPAREAQASREAAVTKR